MSTAALLFFPLAMALAGFYDLFTMTISNKLVLALAAGFFIVALAINLPIQQLAMHVLAAFIVLAGAFILFALRFIGGGDAKLAAATTLWLGFGLTVPYLVYASLFGGALTLAILALRHLPMMPILARFDWLERLHDRKTGIPYGIALAVAGVVTYSNSAIFLKLAS
ncbi:prepilin peptidase [Devosia sp.]|uniref:A24 family peptidase n=1 Tax=Devosia sp. TaxID=1871048 RepID=UPI0032642669